MLVTSDGLMATGEVMWCATSGEPIRGERGTVEFRGSGKCKMRVRSRSGPTHIFNTIDKCGGELVVCWHVMKRRRAAVEHSDRAV